VVGNRLANSPGENPFIVHDPVNILKDPGWDPKSRAKPKRLLADTQWAKNVGLPFGWLHNSRRLVVRWDRHLTMCVASFHVALIVVWLRKLRL
jgi:hypothetical protein